MLGEYVNVKNKGFNQTIIHNNSKRFKQSKISWDANYDGQNGNMALDISKNGRKKHIDIKFNNEDLADILNIPSVNVPLEQRLRNDFLGNYGNNPPMIIEFMSRPKPSINSDNLEKLFVRLPTTRRKKSSRKTTTKRKYKVIRVRKSTSKNSI